MLFSMFRSHRNRFVWRNGQLHIIKENRIRREILTEEQEEREFQRDIRQWLIFYGVLISIIIAMVIHQIYSRRKTPLKT